MHILSRYLLYKEPNTKVGVGSSSQAVTISTAPQPHSPKTYQHTNKSFCNPDTIENVIFICTQKMEVLPQQHQEFISENYTRLNVS
jgi:hypothetical protein